MKRILTVAFFLFLAALPVAADQSSPDGAVKALYDWYQNAGDRYRDSFGEARPYFSNDIYQLLDRGFQLDPSQKFWVDFDPFVNAQVPASKFSIGKPFLTGDSAFVRVRPYMSMGEGKTMAMPDIKVYLTKSGGNWQVANLIYTGDNAFELRKYLQEGLASVGGGESADTMMSPEQVDNEQQAQGLAGSLLGTWVHKATSKTAEGEASPLQIAVIKWTFKPGGKCDFYQKVGSGNPMVASGRPYTVEGNTITLGGRTKYTVVKNMGDKMIWKNHRLGDFYHVVRE